MKNKLSMLLVLLLLSSCVVNNGSPTISESNNKESSAEEQSSPSESETSVESSSPSEETSPVVENPFEGYHELMEGLYVNYKPGVYNEDINIEFKLANPNASVHYTLDHTIPSETSTRYNSPHKSTSTKGLDLSILTPLVGDIYLAS